MSDHNRLVWLKRPIFRINFGACFTVPVTHPIQRSTDCYRTSVALSQDMVSRYTTQNTTPTPESRLFPLPGLHGDGTWVLIDGMSAQFSELDLSALAPYVIAPPDQRTALRTSAAPMR